MLSVVLHSLRRRGPAAYPAANGALYLFSHLPFFVFFFFFVSAIQRSSRSELVQILHEFIYRKILRETVLSVIFLAVFSSHQN